MNKYVRSMVAVICFFAVTVCLQAKDLNRQQVENLAQQYYKKAQRGNKGPADIWLNSIMRGKDLWGKKGRLSVEDQDEVRVRAEKISEEAQAKAAEDAEKEKFKDDGVPFIHRDFEAWRLACMRLPGCVKSWRDGTIPERKSSADENKRAQGILDEPWDQFGYYQGCALSDDKEVAAKEYQKALHRLFAAVEKLELAQTASWLGDAPAIQDLVHGNMMIGSPHIFAEKELFLPNSELIFFGDLHGDIHSLLKLIENLQKQGYMDGFKVIKPNSYLIFLGDYCDRGMYGVEVIYTLLRIALENPASVLFVRGNHEDPFVTGEWGFQVECQAKLGKDLINEHQALYNIMPAVLYAGCHENFLQCCHGGIEVGFRPQSLLDSDKMYQQLGQLDQPAFMAEHPKIKTMCKGLEGKKFVAAFPTGKGSDSSKNPKLGFMWNDFLKTGMYNYAFGRGSSFGQDVTQAILQVMSTPKNKLRGIIRAHQHTTKVDKSSPLNFMGELLESNGFFTMWQPLTAQTHRNVTDEESVFMMNVAPDTPYGNGCNFGFATCVILRVAEAYKDWQFKVVTTQVVDPKDVPGIQEAVVPTADGDRSSAVHHDLIMQQLLELNQTLHLL